MNRDTRNFTCKLYSCYLKFATISFHIYLIKSDSAYCKYGSFPTKKSHISFEAIFIEIPLFLNYFIQYSTSLPFQTCLKTKQKGRLLFSTALLFDFNVALHNTLSFILPNNCLLLRFPCKINNFVLKKKWMKSGKKWKKTIF